MVNRDSSPRFEVLGPLRAFWKDTEVALGWPRQQAVLVALLMRAGQVVSRDELIDAVWGADPPATAAKVVHAYIAGLRKALEPGRERREAGRLLTSVSRGYVLHVAEGHLDLKIAGRHMEQARRAQATGDLQAAAAELEVALALWRGVPLAGVPGPLAEIERARLAELRSTLLEDRAETMLRLGRAAELTSELATFVAEHPFRERMAGLLMSALYQAGRPAEALAAYRATRRTLANELGIEPGPNLRRLHDDILNNRDIVRPGPAATASGAAAVPRQLPSVPRQFSGRTAELTTLAALAREARQAGTVLIAAIGGTAGVGKSTLAVRFAHQVASQFPDGQLYADLRGFGDTGTPAEPHEVMRGFLEAFSIETGRIPADPRSLAGLYRTVLASKRVLLLLDDARDEDQVRQVLPGGSGSLVLITSRRLFTGLAATHGAFLLTLDVLSDDEARELLARRLGAARVAAEPEAVDEIARLCAYLPLALSVAAARAAGRPHLSLSALAAELRDESRLLEVLDGGEAASSIRSAFSCSYRELSNPAARMFRLLGVHPGPDVTIPAAASLAAITAGEARRAVAELTSQHLIGEHAPGRFAFHDLLRAYAAGRSLSENSRPAIQRMLDHYLLTALAATVWLHPGREPPFSAAPLPGAEPEPLGSREEALAWLEAEHQVLLAAVALAAREGFDKHAWQLAWCLVTFLYRRGHWSEWSATQRIALAAALRLGDLAGQARAHLDLGYIGVVSGSRRGVRTHLRRALTMFGQLDDHEGQARAHNAMAGFLEGQHRYQDALRHAQLSLDLYLTTGNKAAHANALTDASWLRALLGDWQRAISDSAYALDLHRELGNQHGEAAALKVLGYAHQQAGRYSTAVGYYREALAIRRQLRDLQHQAETLNHLGDTHCALGQEAEAREAWQQALVILNDLHHREAGKVLSKLLDKRTKPPALNLH